MKFWIPAAALLLAASGARAGDYRVVYSPSLELEVYIDDVSGNAPQSWCARQLPLRIVSGNSSESDVLQGFLPQVGTLLHNQCGKLLELPWKMTNARGSVLATGTAVKEQDWRPIVTADATGNANASNAAPLDLSKPANAEPLQHFDLPGGCHFRTWWDDNGQSLFIPDDKTLACSTEGWLEGASQLTLTSNGETHPLQVWFYQGYPLLHLQLQAGQFEIVSVNNQRMVIASDAQADSWLVLPFDPVQHAWSFDGTLLLKMDKSAAADAAALKNRVAEVRQKWAASVDPAVKVNVLLVDDLHADLADPAIGAWRSVN